MLSCSSCLFFFCLKWTSSEEGRRGRGIAWKLSGLLKWVSYILCLSSGNQIFIFLLGLMECFYLYILLVLDVLCKGKPELQTFFPLCCCIKSLGIGCRCSGSAVIGTLWRDTSCTPSQGTYYISSHVVYIVGNAQFLSLSETSHVCIYQCLCRKKKDNSLLKVKTTSIFRNGLSFLLSFHVALIDVLFG